MRLDQRLTPDRAVLFGLVVTAAIYCRDLRYDFILDDLPLILLNETFSSWHNWTRLFATHISTSGSLGLLSPAAPAAHYRPVYMLWLMINTRLFGASPPWLHLTSLLLHVLVVFLAYKLALKILTQPWTAALAALLFALHPIHVESVAYISASADILAALFLLLSLLGYLRLRDGTPPSTVYLAASIVTAALSMLSKETGAMIPWALVTYECLRRGPQGSPPLSKRLFWTLPYFGVVAAYAVVRTALFGANLGPGSAEHKLSALSNVPLVFLAYLRNLLWPFHLSFFYPTEWTVQWTIFRAVLIVLAVAGAVWLWRRQSAETTTPLLLLWGAIFSIPALSAVFIFVRDDWVHDRHMYLVSLPFCMLVAALLTHTARRGAASLAGGVLVSTTFAVVTFLQVPRFQDELTLYQSAMKVAPRSINLHGYYANALLNYGRTDDALREYGEMTTLWPRSADAHESYAATFLRVGKQDEAAIEFEKALEYAPGPTPFRSFVLYRLATIELGQSKVCESAAHLREAIRIDPEQLNYHATLAQALRREGLTQEADAELQRETIVRAAFLAKGDAMRSGLPRLAPNQ